MAQESEQSGRGRDEIRRRYEQAVDQFVDKVKQDRTIIAAILFGSLAYDEVWEKSDIDLMLVSTEDKKGTRFYSLVENGLNIHAGIGPRSEFKAWIERSLESSWAQSIIARSRLLFSRDETLAEYYRAVTHLGQRDKEAGLLRAATSVLPPLAKAEKWLHVKGDLDYSVLWILYTLEPLARVEVLLHDETPGREAIPRALQLNPDFFGAVYTDLMHGPKDRAAIAAALRRIDGYLEERRYTLFGPIMDYLAQAGGIRSSSELDEHFKRRAQTDSLSFAYEWLADCGVIHKVSSPLRLTEKGRIAVDEAAYYYDEEERG